VIDKDHVKMPSFHTRQQQQTDDCFALACSGVCSEDEDRSVAEKEEKEEEEEELLATSNANL
jgi:hypothetical protein